MFIRSSKRLTITLVGVVTTCFILSGCNNDKKAPEKPDTSVKTLVKDMKTVADPQSGNMKDYQSAVDEYARTLNYCAAHVKKSENKNRFIRNNRECGLVALNSGTMIKIAALKSKNSASNKQGNAQGNQVSGQKSEAQQKYAYLSRKIAPVAQNYPQAFKGVNRDAIQNINNIFKDKASVQFSK